MRNGNFDKENQFWAKIVTIFGLLLVALGLSWLIWAASTDQVASQTDRLTWQRHHLTLEQTPAVLPTITSVPTPTPQTISMLFGGDMMFDRHIRQKAESAGSYEIVYGKQLRVLMDQQDYLVANLEGPITDFPSRSVGSAVGSTDNYIFTFDPAILAMLSRWPWVFNLGNNHLLNFGEVGWQQTQDYLVNSQLDYFGNVSVGQTEKRSIILEQNGLKIGLVNYNQFISSGEQIVFEDIALIKDQADFVIVYAHWGYEYVQENQVTIDLAHRLIDAGADAVIGSHPHVVQGQEVYQGKKIYYSLGNFVFDQYFETAVKNGLLVKAEFTQGQEEIHFTEFPIVINMSGETELK